MTRSSSIIIGGTQRPPGREALRRCRVQDSQLSIMIEGLRFRVERSGLTVWSFGLFGCGALGRGRGRVHRAYPLRLTLPPHRVP